MTHAEAVRAVERLDTALERWKKATATIADGWRSQADIRDRNRRLTELDEAIMHAENLRDDCDVAAALDRAHRIMMGRPAA